MSKLEGHKVSKGIVPGSSEGPHLGRRKLDGQEEAGLSNRKRLAQTPSKSRLELRIEPGSLLVCPGLAVAESLLPHAQSALELPLE